MAYAIDTLAGAKDLERAGVPDKQAEAIVHLITQQGEGLATKTDIAALRGDMATKADIAALDGKIEALNDKMATKTDLAEMKAGLAEMKTQLLISMIGIAGVIIAAIKLL